MAVPNLKTQKVYTTVYTTNKVKTVPFTSTIIATGTSNKPCPTTQPVVGTTTTYSASVCVTTEYQPFTTSTVNTKSECYTKTKGYGGY